MQISLQTLTFLAKSCRDRDAGSCLFRIQKLREWLDCEGGANKQIRIFIRGGRFLAKMF